MRILLQKVSTELCLLLHALLIGTRDQRLLVSGDLAGEDQTSPNLEAHAKVLVSPLTCGWNVQVCFRLCFKPPSMSLRPSEADTDISFHHNGLMEAVAEKRRRWQVVGGVSEAGDRDGVVE